VDEVNQDGIMDIVNSNAAFHCKHARIGPCQSKCMSVLSAMLYLPRDRHISINKILRQS